LQSQLESAQIKCDEISAARQEVEALANRLQQNLTSNSLEFARLQQEHDELQGMTAKLATRVFELKQKLELSELPIRRFAVQKVSPSLLLSPAMVSQFCV
jgi:predicted nuclease with TOPRIM domain